MVHRRLNTPKPLSSIRATSSQVIAIPLILTHILVVFLVLGTFRQCFPCRAVPRRTEVRSWLYMQVTLDIPSFPICPHESLSYEALDFKVWRHLHEAGPNRDNPDESSYASEKHAEPAFARVHFTAE